MRKGRESIRSSIRACTHEWVLYPFCKDCLASAPVSWVKIDKRQCSYPQGCAARSCWPWQDQVRLDCHLVGRHSGSSRCHLYHAVALPALSPLAGAEGEEEGVNTDFWRHWFENFPTCVNDHESGLLGPLILPVNNSLHGVGQVSSPLCFPSVD